MSEPLSAAASASDTDDLLTPTQVARRLQVKIRTLGYWRRAGNGPPWMKVGKFVRYQERALAEWIAHEAAKGEQRP